MKLLAVGLGFPPHYVDQDAVANTLGRLWVEQGRSAEAVRRLHRATTVQTRHFTLPLEAYAASRSFAEANDAFIKTATDIGEAAVRDALARTDFEVGDVDMIMFVTTTGLSAPSIDARLVNRVGFRPNIKRTPVFGLGCAGGAAGVARCSDYVKAYPDQVALCVSVELCSLTFQRDDFSIANLVGTGLFGDGAACAVVAGHDRATSGKGARIRIVASRAVFYGDTEGVLGWAITDTGFRIVLSDALPDVVRSHLRHDVDQFLAEQGLRREDIGAWVVHPGGPKVLCAVEETLMLPETALRRSRESLSRVGNVSSASVLSILHDVIDDAPPPGTNGLMIGMGPGFSVEVVLLRWE